LVDDWSLNSLPGRRTEGIVEKVGKIVNEYGRSAFSVITGRVSLSYGTYQRILSENLNMWDISAKSGPQFLTDEQKQRRFLAPINIDAVP
jgi:hypothetical protein